MTDNNHHHHHHHHSPEGGWTEKNRAHWDKMASTYNSPEKNREFGDLLNKITSFLLENINWIGVSFIDPSSTFESSSKVEKEVRVLDYACGPGTVTAALAGYATEYVGIDISENMVKEYNNRFTSLSSSSDSTAESLNAKAIVGDLFVPSGPSSHLSDKQYFDFDLAVVSGGFHHFENVELATERLAERLKPGGILLIFDFLSHAPDDLHDNPAMHTVVHHGFDEHRVKGLFTGAGLTDFDIKIMPEKVAIQGKAFRTGFLAKAKKSAA